MEPLTEEFFKMLVKAASSGQWYFLLALVLSAAVYALRRYGSQWIPWLKTDMGGATLALAGGALGAMATAFMAGQKASWVLVLAAFKIGFTAMGGYATLRKVVWPLVAKLLKLKTPEEIKADATAAGDKAVEDKPSPGITGFVGKSKDVK